jgi:Bacterial Ig-like domain
MGGRIGRAYGGRDPPSPEEPALPVRARLATTLLSLLVAVAGVATSAPPPVRAAAEKVAIIVGPVGSLTANYRSRADDVAAAAQAAGATVAKAYSPNATWANVKSAVNGADVIVYFGHGNGYPNPYTTGYEYIDRVNGWGLNRTTTNGDADNWSTTMVYCGEKALLGTLTSSDDATRRTYCGGTANDGITPAPGFVMIYGQAHYAPGFGERYEESDPITTLSEAQQRVRNYSYPVLRLGASAYFATAYGDADDILTRVLTQRTRTYGEIFGDGRGYSASALRTMAHPDISGASVWVQKTVNGSMHFGDPDYWYAFAGNPDRTPSGTVAPAAPRITRLYPGANSTNAGTGVVVSATFDQAVSGVSSTSVYLRRLSDSAPVAAGVTYNAYWKRAELRPSSVLGAGTTYVATVTSAIVSASTGRPITTTSWRFTTAAEPTSTEGETYSPAARLTFRQGTHTGYRFDASGQVTAVRTATLAWDSGASASSRVTLVNQSGRWFSVVNGVWAGYWVRESTAISLATAATSTPGTGLTIYDPGVRLSFGRGTHTGYRFDSGGAVVAERTYTLAWDSGANASVRRTLTNQFGSWFYVTNGVWAGYWLRESDVVRLP